MSRNNHNKIITTTANIKKTLFACMMTTINHITAVKFLMKEQHHHHPAVADVSYAHRLLSTQYQNLCIVVAHVLFCFLMLQSTMLAVVTAIVVTLNNVFIVLLVLNCILLSLCG
jgi:hypothetical protein